jgi:hypothetical protein
MNTNDKNDYTLLIMVLIVMILLLIAEFLLFYAMGMVPFFPGGSINVP